MRLGNLVEPKVSVRAADGEHLQTILGFWPAFLTAFALRAYGVFRFPFLDEEGYLVRDAVNSLVGVGPQSGQAPFWGISLFGVPSWTSQAITPLWWWTQYLARLAVPVEDLSTRLPEFAFGLLGLALFFRLARDRRGAGLLFAQRPDADCDCVGLLGRAVGIELGRRAAA